MKSLGDALVENDSLKELDLWGNDIDGIIERGLSALTECLKTNSGLVRLWLGVVRTRNKSPLITVS